MSPSFVASLPAIDPDILPDWIYEQDTDLPLTVDDIRRLYPTSGSTSTLTTPVSTSFPRREVNFPEDVSISESSTHSLRAPSPGLQSILDLSDDEDRDNDNEYDYENETAQGEEDDASTGVYDAYEDEDEKESRGRSRERRRLQMSETEAEGWLKAQRADRSHEHVQEYNPEDDSDEEDEDSNTLNDVPIEPFRSHHHTLQSMPSIPSLLSNPRSVPQSFSQAARTIPSIASTSGSSSSPIPRTSNVSSPSPVPFTPSSRVLHTHAPVASPSTSPSYPLPPLPPLPTAALPPPPPFSRSYTSTPSSYSQSPSPVPQPQPRPQSQTAPASEPESESRSNHPPHLVSTYTYTLSSTYPCLSGLLDPVDPHLLSSPFIVFANMCYKSAVTKRPARRHMSMSTSTRLSRLQNDGMADDQDDDEEEDEFEDLYEIPEPRDIAKAETITKRYSVEVPLPPGELGSASASASGSDLAFRRSVSDSVVPASNATITRRVMEDDEAVSEESEDEDEPELVSPVQVATHSAPSVWRHGHEHQDSSVSALSLAGPGDEVKQPLRFSPDSAAAAEVIGLFLQTPYSAAHKDSIGGFPVRTQLPSKKDCNERGGAVKVKGLFRGLQLGWRERIQG